jgi:hypothetical protein
MGPVEILKKILIVLEKTVQDLSEICREIKEILAKNKR